MEIRVKEKILCVSVPLGWIKVLHTALQRPHSQPPPCEGGGAASDMLKRTDHIFLRPLQSAIAPHLAAQSCGSPTPRRGGDRGGVMKMKY